MEKLEADELLGRLVALETLLAVTIGQIAETTGDPAGLIRRIMANAEDMLERAAAAAAPGDRAAAQYARAAFEELGDAMENHLRQRAADRG